MAYDTGKDRARDVFVTGLRNAHALENQALLLMNRQIERIEHYPQVKDRLQRHVEETQSQIKRLDMLLGRLNEQPSTLKDTGTSIMGNLGAITHAFSQDEILKNTYANYAFENFEIASYKSLCQLAELTGNANALQPLRQTLEEEEAMASWIDQHLSDVTSTYFAALRRGRRGQDVKPSPRLQACRAGWRSPLPGSPSRPSPSSPGPRTSRASSACCAPVRPASGSPR